MYGVIFGPPHGTIPSAIITNRISKCIINRIVHSWSYHMKLIKLAEVSFNKFHVKWPIVWDPLYGKRQKIVKQNRLGPEKGGQSLHVPTSHGNVKD